MKEGRDLVILYCIFKNLIIHIKNSNKSIHQNISYQKIELQMIAA